MIWPWRALSLAQEAKRLGDVPVVLAVLHYGSPRVWWPLGTDGVRVDHPVRPRYCYATWEHLAALDLVQPVHAMGTARGTTRTQIGWMLTDEGRAWASKAHAAIMAARPRMRWEYVGRTEI